MSSHLLPSELREYVASIVDFPEPGIIFRDISPLIGSGKAFRSAIELMSARFEGTVDVIAGIDARGFVFGAALAHRLGVGLALIRKPGKLPNAAFRVDYELEYGSDALELADGAISPGQDVLLVDDVLATGGTAKAALELVDRAGAATTAAQFLIEIETLKGREMLGNIPVASVLKY